MREAVNPSEGFSSISSQPLNPEAQFTPPQPEKQQPVTPESKAAFKEKMLAKIEQQQMPSPQEQWENAVWQRQNNPQFMSAEKLREFQELGRFEGHEPRELTPEQTAAEEAEMDELFNAAYPDQNQEKQPISEPISQVASQPISQQRYGEIIDEAFSPENSIFKRKQREKFPNGQGVQINGRVEKAIRKDQGYSNDHPYMQKEDF